MVQLHSQSCLDAAFRYLSYRSRSEAELRLRLKRRNFNPQVIEEVLDYLKEQGLVDDAAFAQWWKENRESFSPRSRMALKRELYQKGISKEITAAVISEVDEDTSACRAARKKAKVLSTLDYNLFRNTLLAFLRQRGFSYEVCRHTVDRIWEEKIESYGE